MKNFFISLLFSLLLPSLCSAAFIIHLKNGSKFETSSYWKEGQSVKFIYKGGELGLDKTLISSIEHTEEIFVDKAPAPREILPEKPQKVEKKKVEATNKKGSKKDRKTRRKIDSLMKRFSYLQGQFKQIDSISTGRAIALVKKMINFRDIVFRENLDDDFTKEISEVNSMIDAVEVEVNSRS